MIKAFDIWEAWLYFVQKNSNVCTVKKCTHIESLSSLRENIIVQCHVLLVLTIGVEIGRAHV